MKTNLICQRFSGTPACNEAVLRDSGSISAPSSVKIVKLPLRLQVQWSRNLAKPLGRYMPPSRTAQQESTGRNKMNRNKLKEV